MAAVDSEWRYPQNLALATAPLLVLTFAAFAPVSVHAATTVVRVLDETGVWLTDGSVVFCPLAADCLECPVTNDGTIALDRSRLTAGAVYTIIVYDAGRVVRYAAFEWTYDPADFEAAPGSETVTPRLRGNARQEVFFDFSAAVDPPPAATPTPAAPAALAPVAAAPVAQTPTQATADPRSPDAPRPYARPRFVVGAGVPFMFGGNFGVDHDALGGVDDVAPGFGAFIAYRFGYPASFAPGQAAMSFRELSLNYGFNRYTVVDTGEPATTSDLTFHRVNLAYGVGRLTTRTMVSGAAAVGYGGVYDGGELLQIGERTYGMLGLGVQGRCAWRLLAGAARGLWLAGQLDLMYYPADHGDDDHWYGLAPSAAAGIMIH